MPFSILVVDDDKGIVQLVRDYLEKAGYPVYPAYDGEQAWYILRREVPTMVILDLMMPKRDGWTLTQQIRSSKTLSSTPILILTARGEDDDKLRGFDLGTDDYVTKPFNPNEIVQRVKAILRRFNPDLKHEVEKVLSYKNLMLNLGRREVTQDGRIIDLTRKEFDLLRIFMAHPRHLLTRMELIEEVFEFSNEMMNGALDSHIKNLRKKIEQDPKNPDYILTTYGIGYSLGDL